MEKKIKTPNGEERVDEKKGIKEDIESGWDKFKDKAEEIGNKIKGEADLIGEDIRDEAAKIREKF